MAEEKSKKRLGRGLAALIGDLDKPVSPQSPKTEIAAGRGERLVPIEQVRANPNNPRRHFVEAELQDLAASIREHGVVQPILVRPVPEGSSEGARYEIIAGERRWRAAQKVSMHEVPVIIRDMEDKQALEIAIIENVQRSDLNAVEEALGYQQLIDEYSYTQSDLAKAISKSRSHVANTLRLLKLPKSVQELVSNGALSAGHARALITVDNPEKLAKKIVTDGLSVRQTESIAQAGDMPTGSTGQKSRNAGNKKSSDTEAVEQRLEEVLGLKIDLRHGDKASGELRIKYQTLEQLDEICRRLGAAS